MNTTSQQTRIEGTRDAFLDIASILAVALIALVLLVATNPRFGRDLGTVLGSAGTHSSQVTTQAAGR